MKNFSRLFILLMFIFVSVVFSASAFASPTRTTYQAKIIKPDGTPLEATSVNFRFTIMDPAGSCVLYVEDYASVNMTGSAGFISFPLGSGIRSYPASATQFADVFDNSTSALPCQPAALSPPTYTPVQTDFRKIVMQFQDTSGWQTLPAMSINSVPYANYADKAVTAQNLNGKTENDFAPSTGLQNCGAGYVLTFNNASFSCVAMATSSGTVVSGVNSVSGTAPIMVGGTASAPVISMTVASMSTDGYLSSVDYAEFKSKLAASATSITNTLGYTPLSVSATLSGDVSGTFSANQVETVGGRTASDIALTVDAIAAATASNTANTVVKRDNTGSAAFTNITADTGRVNYLEIYKPSTNFNVRLQAPTSLSSTYTLVFPNDAGSSGQVLRTDGAGNLTWVNASAGTVSAVVGTAGEIVVSGANSVQVGLADTGTSGVY